MHTHPNASWTAPLRAVATLLLAPLAAAGQEPELAPERSGGGRVLGAVMELGGERPLMGATVLLTLPGGAPAGTREADEDGRFLFTALAPGRYFLEIRTLGYRTARDSLEVTPGSLTLVEAELAPEALELEPIVVTTTRRGRLDTAGFEDRRRLGIGSFLAGDEIRSTASRASDLLRGQAGVRVVPLPGRSAGEIRMRGECRPDLVIDGMRVRPGGGLSIDDLVSASDVEALEIYRGAQAPPQYSSSSCGAVLVWTRLPDPTLERGSPWKRLLVAGGLALGAFLLMR